MKKFKLIILLALFIGLVSCQKPAKDPVLNMSQTVASVITSPQNGSSIILSKEQSDSTIVITWSETQYNLDELSLTNYSLEMDYADSSFSKPVVIASSTGTSYQTTVGALNTKLQAAFKANAGDAVSYAYRVRAFINNSSDYSQIYSAPVTVTYTPYSDVIVVSPIYMLGSATLAGWDNTLALEMTPLTDGKFSIVSTLTAGTDMFVKFISDLGAWAPQWGTDASGTSTDGSLVYRPTEDEPDPAAIPAPDVTGDYLITVDTAQLTYTISATSATLFLVGDACSAGWDNANGLPFTKDAPGLFSLTTNLTASGGLKFLEVSGQWAPQWGTNDSGEWSSGTLVYRPTESVPDPANIPAPPSAGSYLIQLNLNTQTYVITEQ